MVFLGGEVTCEIIRKTVVIRVHYTAKLLDLIITNCHEDILFLVCNYAEGLMVDPVSVRFYYIEVKRRTYVPWWTLGL